MYDYLKEIGLYPSKIWRDASRKRHPRYHMVFGENKDNNLRIDSIITDWGYLRGFDTIYLCANEVVIESPFESCKVNIKYNEINKFEVILVDKDEEYLPIP